MLDSAHAALFFLPRFLPDFSLRVPILPSFRGSCAVRSEHSRPTAMDRKRTRGTPLLVTCLRAFIDSAVPYLLVPPKRTP